MTLEQIVLFIFAFIIISVSLYSKNLGHNVFPEIGLGLGVLLVVLGGINPATIKTLHWKDSATGQELSFDRHQPTKNEIEQILALSDEKKDEDISDEPLVKAAKERADRKKSAADYLLLATEAWKKEQYEKALRYAYTGLELNPADIRIKASLQTRIATVYHDMGDLELGIAVYKKAMQTDPSYAGAQNNLGTLYLEQNKFIKAERLFRKAIELDPNDPMPHNNLGSLYFRQGKYKKAEPLFLTAIELEPKESMARNNLGSLYAKQREYKKAERLFRKSIEVNPKNTMSLNKLGSLYLEQNNFTKAESFFQKAIEYDPKDSMSHNNFGCLYFKQGKYTEAESSFRKAIDLDSGNVEALQNLEELLATKKSD
jgi:Flp pilus assembly protein TadD